MLLPSPGGTDSEEASSQPLIEEEWKRGKKRFLNASYLSHHSVGSVWGGGKFSGRP